MEANPRGLSIPPAVDHLAGEVLHSVCELEVALLARTSPERVWCAASVRGHLRIGYAQAQEALARLAAIGLMESVGGGYRYRPRSHEVSEALNALAALYRSHRLAILRLVCSRSKGKVSYFGQALPRDGS